MIKRVIAPLLPLFLASACSAVPETPNLGQAIASVDPQARVWMDKAAAFGQECGMQTIGVGVDLGTSEGSVEWNPLEDGVEGKLRCLDGKLRAAGLRGIGRGSPQ